MPLASIPEILDDLRAGRMIVLTDDEDRENEGDLVLPAQFASPDAIAFMLAHARGYLCLSLTGDDCDRLRLAPQTPENTSVRSTPFTVSIDGHPRHGFTTGVSARERARTIQLAIDPASGAADFVRPGHVNPLRARNGGVLVRTGQTEGSVDLCRLAGLRPAAVIIEILREDGELARGGDLDRFCEAHALRMCSIAQIVEHRLARESLVRRLDPPHGVPVRTREGEFTLLLFESATDPQPHVALTMGGVGMPDADGRIPECAEPTLVRVHRRDLLGDVFGAIEAETGQASGEILRGAMRAIRREGRGALVYLRQEGTDAEPAERIHSIRGTGAGAMEGRRSREWREVGIGSQILRDLALSRLRLITNSRTEHPALEGFGIRIVERVPIAPTDAGAPGAGDETGRARARA